MFFPLINFVIKIVFVPIKNKHQNKIRMCLTVFPLEVFLIKVFFMEVFYKITIKWTLNILNIINMLILLKLINNNEIIYNSAMNKLIIS